MNAAFRTPLTTPQIREILAGSPPDRVDCGLLRRAAPARVPAPGGSRAAPPGRRDTVLSGER